MRTILHLGDIGLVVLSIDSVCSAVPPWAVAHPPITRSKKFDYATRMA